LAGPNRSTASRAYAEHEGSKRHEEKVSGDRK